ncbi:MAG: DUF6541 family protein [Candidatus Woesearchaeota archaeon]
MNTLTIILFFTYSWGVGFMATYFLKNSENFLERNLMRVGVGLGILPILAYLLNILGVPIDWRIYAGLSLFGPAILLYQGRSKIRFAQGIRKSDLYTIAALAITILSFMVFLKGSFIYPWLEDGDPWDYAVTAKHISIYKTTAPPAALFDRYFESNLKRPRLISNYNEPYPQGYSIIMGLLLQTNSSVSWTLKFFNSLIISLALLFFYFFAKEFMGDNNKALFSTLVLAAVPCFVSHFIYSQALAITLFLPAFYCLERTKHDRWWAIAAIPIIASILMTQSSSAGMFGAIFFPLYWLGKVFVNRKFMKWIFIAGVGGLLLSFTFWGTMITKYTWKGTDPNHGDTDTSIVKSSLARDVYTLKDFYTAPAANKIDNPVGLGPVVFWLAVVALLLAMLDYKRVVRTDWILVSIAWVAINFINVNSANLPISINNHRAWSFLAIAVALFASYGMWQIAGLLRSLLKSLRMNEGLARLASLALIVAVVLAVIVTSWYPKYLVNTSIWPTHYFASPTDIEGYMWLENLPDNTMVTSLCRPDEKAIGMDMASTKPWDPEQRDYQQTVLNKSVHDIHLFLSGKGYDYMILDSSCVEYLGLNATNNLLTEMVSSDNYRLIYPFQQDQQSTTFIFQLA